jgi:hypothetical protein
MNGGCDGLLTASDDASKITLQVSNTLITTLSKMVTNNNKSESPPCSVQGI